MNLMTRLGAARKPTLDGLGTVDLGMTGDATLTGRPSASTSRADRQTSSDGADGTGGASVGSLAALLQRRSTIMAAGVDAAAGAGTAVAGTSAAAPAAASQTVDDMFKQADANGDGVLDKDEFVNFDGQMNANGPHLIEAATGIPVDGNYMFAVIDHQNKGFVTLGQAKEHGYLVPEAKQATRNAASAVT